MEVDIKKELKGLIQQLKSLSYDQGQGFDYERYVTNMEHRINDLVDGLQLVKDTKPMEVDTPNTVKDVHFSMNRYDNKGDIVENGVSCILVILSLKYASHHTISSILRDKLTRLITKSSGIICKNRCLCALNHI